MNKCERCRLYDRRLKTCKLSNIDYCSEDLDDMDTGSRKRQNHKFEQYKHDKENW